MILQQNWVKTAIPALSSGQNNLQTPKDQYKNPHTNNKDHLARQLTKGRVHKTKSGKSLVFCQTPLPQFGIFMKNIKFQCVFWPFLGHFWPFLRPQNRGLAFYCPPRPLPPPGLAKDHTFSGFFFFAPFPKDISVSGRPLNIFWGEIIEASIQTLESVESNINCMTTDHPLQRLAIQVQ